MATPAIAVLYTFDELAVGVHSSNAVAGLHIEAGSIPSNRSVGDTFTFAIPQGTFSVATNAGHATDRIIYAVATRDLLIVPEYAFTAASVWSDGNEAAGGEDVIRMLGLRATGTPYQYTVLAIDSGLDGTIQLAIDGHTFDALILECTTEQEGFTDLDLTPVPDPATLTTLGIGLALVSRRRKAGQSITVASRFPSRQIRSGRSVGR